MKEPPPVSQPCPTRPQPTQDPEAAVVDSSSDDDDDEDDIPLEALAAVKTIAKNSQEDW